MQILWDVANAAVQTSMGTGQALINATQAASMASRARRQAASDVDVLAALEASCSTLESLSAAYAAAADAAGKAARAAAAAERKRIASGGMAPGSPFEAPGMEPVHGFSDFSRGFDGRFGGFGAVPSPYGGYLPPTPPAGFAPPGAYGRPQSHAFVPRPQTAPPPPQAQQQAAPRPALAPAAAPPEAPSAAPAAAPAAAPPPAEAGAEKEAAAESQAEESQEGDGAEAAAAATAIQARYRGHQARAARRQQSAAAQTIQARYRGHRARGEVAQAREELAEATRAALVMQARYRGNAARRELAEDGAALEEEEGGALRLSAASHLTMAAWRVGAAPHAPLRVAAQRLGWGVYAWGELLAAAGGAADEALESLRTSVLASGSERFMLEGFPAAAGDAEAFEGAQIAPVGLILVPDGAAYALGAAEAHRLEARIALAESEGGASVEECTALLRGAAPARSVVWAPDGAAARAAEDAGLRVVALDDVVGEALDLDTPSGARVAAAVSSGKLISTETKLQCLWEVSACKGAAWNAVALAEFPGDAADAETFQALLGPPAAEPDSYSTFDPKRPAPLEVVVACAEGVSEDAVAKALQALGDGAVAKDLPTVASEAIDAGTPLGDAAAGVLSAGLMLPLGSSLAMLKETAARESLGRVVLTDFPTAADEVGALAAELCLAVLVVGEKTDGALRQACTESGVAVVDADADADGQDLAVRIAATAGLKAPPTAA